jgi:hypothetical protein
MAGNREDAESVAGWVRAFCLRLVRVPGSYPKRAVTPYRLVALAKRQVDESIPIMLHNGRRNDRHALPP